MTDFSSIQWQRRQRTSRPRWRPASSVIALAALAALLLTLGGPASRGQSAQQTSSSFKTESSSETSTKWLVMTSGERIELQEPWRIDASGRRVLFRPVGDVLKTVRASEVDFEASKKQPAEKTRATEQDQPEARSAALVLEDGDVSAFEQAEPETIQDSSKPAVPSGSVTPERPPVDDKPVDQKLEIVSYSDISEPGGQQVVIYGTVKNTGTKTANRASVRVSLLDERGEPLATSQARLVRTDIAAGRTSNFQVTFTSLTPYASVEFELGHK